MRYLLGFLVLGGVAAGSAYLGYLKGASYKTKYDAIKAELENAVNHWSADVRNYAARLKSLL